MDPLRRQILRALGGAIAAVALILSFLLGSQNAASQTTSESPQRSTESLLEAARLRGMALAEMEDGRYDEALALLFDLAELLPDNVLPPINAAICLYQLQRPDEAAIQIARARSLAPNNPQMLYSLARILAAQGKTEAAERTLRYFAETHSSDPRPLYLAALGATRTEDAARAIEYLTEALERAPENLVLMVELLGAAAQATDPEALSDALDAIEDRLNGFDDQQADYAEQIRDRVDADEAEAAGPPATILRNLLRPSELYQIYRVPLTGGRQGQAPLFPQLDFDPALPRSVQGGQDISIAFIDASAESDLGTPTEPSRALLLRTPGSEAILELSAAALSVIEYEGDRFERRQLALSPPSTGPAAAYDINQDTLPDLVVADRQRGLLLYPGSAEGEFSPAAIILAATELGDVTRLEPVDLDHDGDLDLLVLRRQATDLYLQNNGDGSWSERGRDLGVAGPADDTIAAAIADFDEDGDLDLVTATPNHGLRLLINSIVGPFEDGSAAAGLSSIEIRPQGLLVADFDNDGRFDLITWDDSGGHWLRNASGGFESIALPTLEESWRLAHVGDFDNDGDQDVAVVGASGRFTLLRNRHDSWSAEPTDLHLPGARDLLVADLDDDGDLDLHLTFDESSQALDEDVQPLEEDGRAQDPTGRRFWRNDGGNRNQWIRLSLRGKHDNNSKNNTQGLSCRIETRAGDAYQAVLGNGGVNHLGLGARRQADVLRVTWTNGVAQIWQQVAARRNLVEEQVLKGSCPFLYTWNGREFRFHTDLMWRSPLGMVLADGSAAPHASAKDWVLIAGEHLRPEAGELWLQVTEELWETIYVDRQFLLAVDHPSEVELVVDERFAPSVPLTPSVPRTLTPSVPRTPSVSQTPSVAPTTAPLHWIGETRRPSAASDQDGTDVLAKITERDGAHVDTLPLDRYQGLTSGHWLELQFDDLPTDERLRLVLHGWIFPTDSSINFALAQDPGRQPHAPRLDMLTANGTWRTLHESIGFPSGKRKAVVVELPESIGPSVRLRLSTNLQVYWDAARIAIGDPIPEARITRLEPRRADLHYRGFSALYRESPTGPHLFDYARTSVLSPFPDMEGRVTRFGDVLPLLQEGDSHSVVMSAGDAMTVRFDARDLPALAPGWRRDYVLHSDGWVKDGDLHTTLSNSVGPLPYHGMSSYPDQPHSFPSDPAAREYLRRYQTREVDDQPFRTRLVTPDATVRDNSSN